VPLFLLLIWAGVAVGGLFAGRGARLSTRSYAVLLVAAAAALALGALTGHPAGIVVVAVAFGAFQLASVVADTRLQNSITGPARATVTSLAGMSASVATMGVYASYGVLATAAGHGGAFALLCLPYVAVAAWLVRAARRSWTSTTAPATAPAVVDVQDRGVRGPAPAGSTPGSSAPGR
jgi:hypothetical protein